MKVANLGENMTARQMEEMLQRMPPAGTFVLEQGLWEVEINKEDRMFYLHFKLRPAPFLRLTIPMPSIAFAQFVKACGDSLENLMHGEDVGTDALESNPTA